MSTNMPVASLNMETQVLSIMNVLVKTAVAEIIQLFSESSETLRLHLTQSLKENETLRMRMKVMRSELFSLRLQTRTNRPASRFSPIRGNIPKPRLKSQGNPQYGQFKNIFLWSDRKQPLPEINKRFSNHHFSQTVNSYFAGRCERARQPQLAVTWLNESLRHILGYFYNTHKYPETQVPIHWYDFIFVLL